MVHRDLHDDLLLLQIYSGVVWQSKDLQGSHKTLDLLSPRLCFFIVLLCDLCVYRDDSLTSYRFIMRTEQPTINVLYHFKNVGRGLASKLDLSPPVIHYEPFKGGSSVACFWCQFFGDGSPYVCSNHFMFCLGS